MQLFQPVYIELEEPIGIFTGLPCYLISCYRIIFLLKSFNYSVQDHGQRRWHIREEGIGEPLSFLGVEFSERFRVFFEIQVTATGKAHVGRICFDHEPIQWQIVQTIECDQCFVVVFANVPRQGDGISTLHVGSTLFRRPRETVYDNGYCTIRQ